MAGQKSYIIATPDGENHITAVKGGKAPSFATWRLRKDTNEWEHMGWSFQTNLADAQKKALPDFRKYGETVTATRVLPASL